MENKLVLKIAIIIIAFLLVFAIFLIIVVRDLSSNQLSYERANMVVTQPDTNNENETIAVRNETEEIEEEDVYTNSIVIRNLINNNWSRLNVNFADGYEKDDDGYYVYDDGYTLYTEDGVNVKYIVFNQDYENEVIADLRVGAGYDEVIEAFGIAPTFENEQLNMYGYKTKTVYAFFYDDEICIYPNSRLSNSDFEESLFEYLSGNFDGDQTNFVVHIKNNYSDFTAELEGEDVVLTSGNRQIQIRLHGSYQGTEVIIYNGYIEESLMEENKENYNITEERTIDLVEQIETERIISR